jgi:adenylosuccinate lyase
MSEQKHDKYISPFETRYASEKMQFIFSDDNKFRYWRKLWLALAKAEKIAGLNIFDEQIAELEAHVDDINYDVALAREKEVRHDVMAHVYAYGQQCPKAAGIIHLGATSMFVDDNAYVLQMREALNIILGKLVGVMESLAKFAEEYKDLPTLGHTHGQPAQLVTVGKRAVLWLNDFLMDFKELDYRLNSLQLLGNKGATGTQASFVELFKGKETIKVRDPLASEDNEWLQEFDVLDFIERYVAHEFGMDDGFRTIYVVPVSGQTYSRKVDFP